MPPRVVLVGVPGSGKSTVGGVLAELLGVGLRDTDRDIEVVAGKPIPDIFVDDGEPAFRALERAAVATAIAEHDGVLALGGGAVIDEGTRVLLRGARCTPRSRRSRSRRTAAPRPRSRRSSWSRSA